MPYTSSSQRSFRAQTNVSIAACEHMTFSPRPPDSFSYCDKLSLTQVINNARREITKSRVIADQQATTCGSGMQHVAVSIICPANVSFREPAAAWCAALSGAGMRNPGLCQSNDVMIDGFGAREAGACYPYPSDGLHTYPFTFSAF